MPFTGLLQSVKIIGSDYYSIQPNIINSSSNVLTENYRHIYKFITNDNLNNSFNFWIVAVGALISGSIKHNLTIGNTYYSGERIGNFALGGSTIIILSSKIININEDIDYFSEQHIETYIKAGDVVGELVSNEIKQPIKYPKHYYIQSNNKNNDNYYYLLKYIIIFIIVWILIKIYKKQK